MGRMPEIPTIHSSDTPIFVALLKQHTGTVDNAWECSKPRCRSYVKDAPRAHFPIKFAMLQIFACCTEGEGRTSERGEAGNDLEFVVNSGRVAQ